MSKIATITLTLLLAACTEDDLKRLDAMNLKTYERCIGGFMFVNPSGHGEWTQLIGKDFQPVECNKEIEK